MLVSGKPVLGARKGEGSCVAENTSTGSVRATEFATKLLFSQFSFSSVLCAEKPSVAEENNVQINKT